MLLLLIEDDRFFRHFYSLKLKEQGITVEVAENGQEGLEKLKTIRPDVILLDLIMPKKDGFEVLTEISRDQNLRTIPVLVFSILGQNEDIKKAIQLGATGYVNKALVDFDTLLKKVLELTKSKQA